jgi:hypothetical protein
VGFFDKLFGGGGSGGSGTVIADQDEVDTLLDDVVFTLRSHQNPS